MISAIFTAIGSVMTAFVGVLGNAWNSLIALFYNATDGLTDVGTLLLITAGVGLVWGGFFFIRSLIRVRVR